MCDIHTDKKRIRPGVRTVPIDEAVGSVLAHDITEIRKDEFKGRAFRKGHIVAAEDIESLRRLGKERLFVLTIADDDMHEDDAAAALASALMGKGVEADGEPKEGKITIIAAMDGILKVNKEVLLEFNMLGDVMCATLHDATLVKKGHAVACTRAVPLVLKREVVEKAVAIAGKTGVVEVRKLRKPQAGIVVTGSEVYTGRIKDSFATIITGKIEEFGGEVVGMHYVPDDECFIESRLRALLDAGADLLIATGGMSVDPDDVTKFAVKRLGATGIAYGSAVLPGAMILVGYMDEQRDGQDVPIIGVPACGIYHKVTVLDLILPRILAGERIGRKELAELGHGGLCLNCRECRFPVCPFGK